MIIESKKEINDAPSPEDGFVYMLYSRGLIKIGFSVQPHERFRQLRSMSVAPMSLIWLGHGTRRNEAALHQHFSEYRKKGEWFAPGERLRAFIARRPDLGGMTPAARLAWSEANPDKALGP